MWRPTFRIYKLSTGKPPLDTAGLPLDRDSAWCKPRLPFAGKKLEFFSRKLRPHFKFLKRSFPPLNTQQNIRETQTPSCSRSFLTVFFLVGTLGRPPAEALSRGSGCGSGPSQGGRPVIKPDWQARLSPAALGARVALHQREPSLGNRSPPLKACTDDLVIYVRDETSSLNEKFTSCEPTACLDIRALGFLRGPRSRQRCRLALLV